MTFWSRSCSSRWRYVTPSENSIKLTRAQILFTKTRILSVKVCTLECFLAMVPILTQVSRLPGRATKPDIAQTVLTQKLVPLLAKIRTKGECPGIVPYHS